MAMHPFKIWLKLNRKRGFEAARALKRSEVTLSRWFSYSRRMDERDMLEVATFTGDAELPARIAAWQLDRASQQLQAAA